MQLGTTGESIWGAPGHRFGSIWSLAPLLLGALGQLLSTAKAPGGERFRLQVSFGVTPFPNVVFNRLWCRFGAGFYLKIGDFVAEVLQDFIFQ